MAPEKPNIADARFAELIDGTPAVNLEAPGDERDAGFGIGARAKSGLVNYQMREFYRWLKYVDLGGHLRLASYYGIVGNGSADDTSKMQDALDDSAGHVLFLDRPNPVVTSSLQISSRLQHVVGEAKARAIQGGTQIIYTGSGPVFRIGTDNGLSWDAAEIDYEGYDGLQGHWFKHLTITHGSPDTALTLGVSSYRNGSNAIEDWRGGDIYLDHVWIERFHRGFFGINSDLDAVTDLTLAYCKEGIYFGPLSDQATIERLYAIYCDEAVVIDRAHGGRLEHSQFVHCGHASKAPVSVRKGTSAWTLDANWFEHAGDGYNGVDGLALGVAAGIDDGYGPGGVGTTTSLVTDLTVDRSTVYTTPIGSAYHMRCLVALGAAQVRVNEVKARVGSTLGSLHAIVEAPAGTSYTSAEAMASVTGVPQSLPSSKLFLNSGSGSPVFTGDQDMDGILTRTANRHFFRRHGAATGAESFFVGTEGTPGAVFWHADTYPSTGQKNRLRLLHAIQHGSTIAPTAGTWERADLHLIETPSAGSIAGTLCTSGGTQGTWLPALFTGPSSFNVHSASYTILATDVWVIAAGGTGNLSWPLPATPTPGQMLIVMNKNGAFTLTLERSGQVINGLASDIVIASQAGALMTFVNGVGWFAVGLAAIAGI